jgi:sulfite reductase beta subunit-like hemoprotein
LVLGHAALKLVRLSTGLRQCSISCQGSTYCMSSISSAGEVYHAIDAGERGSVTTIAVRIKFLLGEDVSTRLL